MNLTVIILLLSFAIGFFILGFIIRENKKYGYAILSGFVLLLITGLLIGSDGIEYPSGALIDTVNSTTTVTNTYSSTTTLETTSLSLPLILAGFWGLLVTVNSIRSANYEADDESD